MKNVTGDLFSSPTKIASVTWTFGARVNVAPGESDFATTDDLSAQPYAILTDDGSGNGTYEMTFIRTNVIPGAESLVYNGKAVKGATIVHEDVNFGMMVHPTWFSDFQIDRITKVTFANTIKPISTAYWFNGFSNLAEVDASKLDPTNATTISCIFVSCSSLRSVSGLENWNTENVKYFAGAFTECPQLETLNIAGWNTSSAITMDTMFSGDAMLTLDCSAWNVEKVTRHDMFNDNAPGVIAPAWIS